MKMTTQHEQSKREAVVSQKQQIIFDGVKARRYIRHLGQNGIRIHKLNRDMAKEYDRQCRRRQSREIPIVNRHYRINEENRKNRQLNLGLRIRLAKDCFPFAVMKRLQLWSSHLDWTPRVSRFQPVICPNAHQQGLFTQIDVASTKAQETLNKADEVLGQADVTLKQFSQTAQTATDTMLNVESAVLGTANEMKRTTQGITDMMKSSIESITTTLNALVPTVTFTKDMLGVLIKLVKTLVSVKLADSAHTIKVFFLEIFWNFGPDIYKAFNSEVSKYFDMEIATEWMTKQTEAVRVNLSGGISNAPMARNQIDFSGLLEKMMGEDPLKSHMISEVMSHWSAAPLTGALISTLLMVVFGLPSGSFDQCLKYFGDRCRNLNNITVFGKNSVPLFTTMSEWILEQFRGPLVDDKLDAILDGYKEFVAECVSLTMTTSDGATLKSRLDKDEKLVWQIDKLYRQGVAYQKILSEKRFGPTFTLQLNSCMKNIEKAKKLSDNTGVFGNKPRMEPLIMHVFGESGVGKSGLAWPLMTDMNAAMCSGEEEARDYAKNIYFRNTEQEFWDGYHGQNCVVFDDFGQRTDGAAKPNEEFMEIIRIGNIAAYPLHMASLEEKQKTKFCSKIVMLTSNNLKFNTPSLSFPDAYRRRVTVCAEIRNKPEFQKIGTALAEGSKQVHRLDTQKTDGPVDTKVYEIMLYDAESQKPLSGYNPMSYDEFLTHCLKKLKTSWDHSRTLLKDLEVRLDTTRVDALRAHLQAGDSEEKKEQLKNPFINPAATAEMQLEDLATYFDAISDELDEQEKHWYTELSPMEKIKINIKHSVQVSVEAGRSFFRAALDSICKLGGVLKILGALLVGFGIWRLISWTKTKTKEISPPVKVKRDSAKKKKITRSEGNLMTCPDCNSVKPCLTQGCSHNIFYGLSVDIAERVINCNEWGMPLRGQISIADDKCVIEASVSNDHITRAAKKANVESVHREGCSGCLNCGKDFSPPHCPGPVDRELPKAHVSEILKARIAYFKAEQEAVVSGDSTTMNVKKTVREAAVSGDSVTVIPKKMTREATVSGDSKTLNAKKVNREATVSGDSITVAPKKMKREGEAPDAEMQAWRDRTAQDLISNRVLSNLYKILRKTTTGWTPVLNGLFIRDTIMLAPYHLLPYLKMQDTIRLENIVGKTYDIPWKDVQVVKLKSKVEKDACLIKFPRFVGAHSDIVKHFQLGYDLSNYNRAIVNLVTLRYPGTSAALCILGNTDAEACDQPWTDPDGKRQELRQGYGYNMPTIDGDCGSPLILQEPSCLRKIAGIHTLAFNDGSRSFSVSVTRSDLDTTLREFTGVIITDYDQMAHLQIVSHDIPCNADIGRDEVIQILKLPAATFGYVGRADMVAFVPGKTDIMHSPIHGKVSEATTKPAYLYSATENLLHKNLAKCAFNTPYIAADMVDAAVLNYKGKLLQNVRPELKKILTFEESIAGCTDTSTYLGSINRSSSPGYPWILEKQGPSKGKTQWLGDDEYVFDEGLRLVVEERIQKAAQGIRSPTIWTDTLKDERRPIEKVNALKTRVFGNGPMDYTIAFRMYFLGFMAHIMEQRINNEQSLGTNVYSNDWKVTSRYLSHFGEKVIAGDFSTFDGTLNTCIMWKFVDVINEFYDDGEENAQIRRTLFLDVVNSLHLCQSVFYTMDHSQPSGNPITTALNSFYNSVSMRIVFAICAKRAGIRHHDFNHHVRMVSYGDDNVVNFTDAVSLWFNQNTITDAYTVIGMTYTDETKSEEEMKDYRTIDQVAYLKRHFRTTEERVFAPLDMSTILEMCNWIRQCPDNVGACKMTCEIAIMELSQHPREVFEEYSRKIISAFRMATNKSLETYTYDEYEQMKIEDYYLQ